MDRILDNVGNGYRLCILGDLKGWRGDRTRAGITSDFGVPRENELVERRLLGRRCWQPAMRVYRRERAKRK